MTWLRYLTSILQLKEMDTFLYRYLLHIMKPRRQMKKTIMCFQIYFGQSADVQNKTINVFENIHWFLIIQNLTQLQQTCYLTLSTIPASSCPSVRINSKSLLSRHYTRTVSTTMTAHDWIVPLFWRSALVYFSAMLLIVTSHQSSLL